MNVAHIATKGSEGIDEHGNNGIKLCVHVGLLCSKLKKLNVGSWGVSSCFEQFSKDNSTRLFHGLTKNVQPLMCQPPHLYHLPDSPSHCYVTKSRHPSTVSKWLFLLHYSHVRTILSETCMFSKQKTACQKRCWFVQLLLDKHCFLPLVTFPTFLDWKLLSYFCCCWMWTFILAEITMPRNFRKTSSCIGMSETVFTFVRFCGIRQSDEIKDTDVWICSIQNSCVLRQKTEMRCFVSHVCLLFLFWKAFSVWDTHRSSPGRQFHLSVIQWTVLFFVCLWKSSAQKKMMIIFFNVIMSSLFNVTMSHSIQQTGGTFVFQRGLIWSWYARKEHTKRCMVMIKMRNWLTDGYGAKINLAQHLRTTTCRPAFTITKE